MPTLDLAEARGRFAAARVARLATVTPDGRPHLVPIVFALSGNTVYSAVDSKPKRTTALARLENVRAHPAVSLLVDHYSEDWSALWWVRVDGTARILTATPEDREAQGAIDRLKTRYPQQTATNIVLAVDLTSISGWTSVR